MRVKLLLSHLMIQIKTALRLGQYNIQNLVNSIANLDNCFG